MKFLAFSASFLFFAIWKRIFISTRLESFYVHLGHSPQFAIKMTAKVDSAKNERERASGAVE